MDGLFTFRVFHIKVLVLLSLLISSAVFAQGTDEERRIDDQITAAEKFYIEYKPKELLQVSKNILQQSEKWKYEKGLACGNFYIACAYYLTGHYDESIQYIEKTLSFTDYLKSDPLQHSKNFGLLGLNYLSSDLHELSIESLKKALSIVNSVQNKDQYLLLNESVYYGRLFILYEKTSKRGSMYYCLNKEKGIHEKLNHTRFYIQRSSSLIRFGNYFFYGKQSDSARYYYEKALSALKGKNHRFEVDALIGLGNVYHERNKDKEALAYYLKSVECSKKMIPGNVIMPMKG